MSVPDKIREKVRERAQNRCEYCSRPEYRTGFPFHVDHIISKKHDGSDEIENLAWACFTCNISKGSDIAGYDAETGKLTAFFNPRTQQWGDHFMVAGVQITGKTAVGRVTVRLFQMNHIDQLEIRQMLQSLELWNPDN